MNIINKIRNFLYEDNNTYYSLPEILKLGTKHPLPIKVEETRGKKMRWNQDMTSPFDYGDIPNHINPADDMAWDIIIAPSSKASDKNLLIAGILRVSENAEKIPYPHGNIPGNHKLILANDGVITDQDEKLLNEYFNGSNVFKKPEFFSKVQKDKVVNEDWEQSTMKKMKLGNFSDSSYKGIAVGPTARKNYGAKKFKNNMPITNPNSVAK